MDLVEDFFLPFVDTTPVCPEGIRSSPKEGNKYLILLVTEWRSAKPDIMLIVIPTIWEVIRASRESAVGPRSGYAQFGDGTCPTTGYSPRLVCPRYSLTNDHSVLGNLKRVACVDKPQLQIYKGRNMGITRRTKSIKRRAGDWASASAWPSILSVVARHTSRRHDPATSTPATSQSRIAHQFT